MEWKVIMTQLTSLRATLGQNMKKKNHTKSGQGTDELFTPSWIFFKQLQFLVPVMEARQSKDTCSFKKTDADNEVKDDTPLKNRPSNKFKDLEKTKHNLMQECLNVMQTTPNTCAEEDTFGRFIAHKLASFDRYKKAMAEKKITELLFDLEYSDMMREGPSESDMTQCYNQSVPVSSNAFGLQGPLRSLYHT